MSPENIIKTIRNLRSRLLTINTQEKVDAIRADLNRYRKNPALSDYWVRFYGDDISTACTHASDVCEAVRYALDALCCVSKAIKSKNITLIMGEAIAADRMLAKAVAFLRHRHRPNTEVSDPAV